MKAVDGLCQQSIHVFLCLVIPILLFFLIFFSQNARFHVLKIPVTCCKTKDRIGTITEYYVKSRGLT